MNDSTNVRIIADNIKKLDSRSSKLDSDVSRLDSRITTLETAVPRIPKDYSTTETATGLKWVDGKEVYTCSFRGKTPTDTSIVLPLTYDSLIHMYGTLKTSTNIIGDLNKYIGVIGSTTGSGITLTSGAASIYQNQDFNLVVIYTKSTPEPAPGNETKKKTTKKG